MKRAPLRMVLDTNCLISTLIFSHGKTGTLRRAWKSEIFIPLVCTQTITELLRVLAYPKFKLSSADIKTLLADFLPWAEVHTLVQAPQNIAQLRDPDDAVFIQLTRESQAAYLVSGDKHLLELKDTLTDITIISVADCIKKLSL